MRWRRARSQDDADGDIESEDVAGTGGLEPSGDDLHPNVVVLDELTRVFANVGSGDDTPDHTDDADDADDADADADDADDDADDDNDDDDERASSAESPSRATIAIGGDDDLPDAVYLDDELGDESRSEPVFIDDDGSSDAIMPKDATSRGIEPRLRQRRIGVRRAAGRRRLWWSLLAAVIVVVVVGVLAVLGSSWFSVDQVSVTGNIYTDPDELAVVVDDLQGTPVLRVDIDDIEERIEDIAWVESARVTTQFPGSASIEIKERTPVASMLGEDRRSRVLDADGRVLTVIEGQPVALVWISGPGTLDLIPGDFAPIGYSSATSLVTKLTPNIRSRVESMLVTPDGSELVLILTSPSGPIEVRFGSAIGDNAQIEKLVRLERKLADIGDDPVTVIDVSTAEVTAR